MSGSLSNSWSSWSPDRAQVVTREEIAGRLWNQEVFVDIEHGINTAIRKIRQTLGDSPDLPQFVQTISGSGYRFIAPVTAVEPEVSRTRPVSSHSNRASSRSVGDPCSAGDSRGLRFSVGCQTPAQTLAGPRLVVSVLVAIAALTLDSHPLAARFLHRGSRAGIGSIAVLPLQNLSGDPGQEYFADGMTDELITELARIPNLRVVSRTSVMANKGSPRSLPDIARQLDVDAIVEGSIVRSGDRIRITAQLIDARTDRHLWAQSFEGSASDVLSLQDSVAQQIASPGQPRARPPLAARACQPRRARRLPSGPLLFQ